jgi:CheY-like chemotaxis protein
MPRLDGLDLSRMLRQRQQALPIMMLSANNHSQAVLKAAGVNHFLAKPCDMVHLKQTLSQVLADRNPTIEI